MAIEQIVSIRAEMPGAGDVEIIRETAEVSPIAGEEMVVPEFIVLPEGGPR